jgi:L-lactate dehydrogenase complex protein LldF
VCPVKIPLPDLMRKLREEQVERGLRPWQERLALKLWTFGALRPGLYGFGARLAMKWLSHRAGSNGMIHNLPLAASWSEGRDMPAPPGKTFRDLYREGGQA